MATLTADEKADKIITGLMGTAVAGALIPLPLAVPFMAAVAGGVVAIGTCYGVTLTKNDAWKLVREFFKAAGLTWTAINVGSVFISSVLYATGAGAPVAITMDVVQSTAIAYAVGQAAKHYFKGNRSRDELGARMRDAFRERTAAMRS
jgi:uncharacterized protein (DUF697 family)